LKRGDVVVAAAKGEFGGKPRPYVVIQSDKYRHSRVILVGCTTDISDTLDELRPRLTPTAENGLAELSDVMIDNPVTARRDRIGQVIGTLAGGEMEAVERALMLVLGLGEG
jgi:mRNA interferase MazF